MLKPSQIIAIFGVFLSMFYIFKYAGANPEYARNLCQELMGLQMEIVSEIRPIIHSDKSDNSFENKLRRALNNLEDNQSFIDRKSRILKIESDLVGRNCPAPNLVQMTRLALDSI